MLKSLGIYVLITLVGCAGVDNASKNNLITHSPGHFEITRLNHYSASFNFTDWPDSTGNSNPKTFEVKSKEGEDIRLVMVHRMTTIIREHFQGDFNWASKRLNRTVVKSARLEDSSDLEDFLMQEYFGSDYKTHSAWTR